MLRRRLSLLTVLVALVTALTSGCGNREERRVSQTSAAAVTTGVVGALTGDPDGEVSPETQLKVAQAISLGEEDDPADF